jgi:hypothetical protein
MKPAEEIAREALKVETVLFHHRLLVRAGQRAALEEVCKTVCPHCCEAREPAKHVGAGLWVHQDLIDSRPEFEEEPVYCEAGKIRALLQELDR